MATKEEIYALADTYNGLVHGDDPLGAIDIEWKNVGSALNFTHVLISQNLEWSADIRKNDTVVSLYEPIVLTVKPPKGYLPDALLFAAELGLAITGNRDEGWRINSYAQRYARIDRLNDDYLYQVDITGNGLYIPTTREGFDIVLADMAKD